MSSNATVILRLSRGLGQKNWRLRIKVDCSSVKPFTFSSSGSPGKQETNSSRLENAFVWLSVAVVVAAAVLLLVCSYANLSLNIKAICHSVLPPMGMTTFVAKSRSEHKHICSAVLVGAAYGAISALAV